MVKDRDLWCQRVKAGKFPQWICIHCGSVGNPKWVASDPDDVNVIRITIGHGPTAEAAMKDWRDMRRAGLKNLRRNSNA